MWEQNTLVANLDAMGAARNTAETRDSGRGGMSFGDLISGGAAMMSSLMQGHSLVGISADKVPAMREAIRDYVTVIEDHLNGIAADMPADGAFKSPEIQKAVTDYITAVQEYCKALTSQLLAFSSKLGMVQAAWEQSSQNFAGNIQGTTGGVAGAATRYDEGQAGW